MEEDGVWVYPGGPGEPALIAWHFGGAIHNVTLLSLSTGADRGAELKSHIQHIAWAGELEGWLSEVPKIHLVAGPEEAREWEPLFQPWTHPPVVVVPPVSFAELAALSAERAGRPGATTSLLPPEFSERYRQQLVDRLWMRGVLSLVAVYLFGVLVYFGVLYGLSRQLDSARAELARISPDYTNAVADEVQIHILKDRANLKYAALDCWMAVAANLPETLALEDMYFAPDRFDLHGSSTSDSPDDIAAFNDALKHAEDANHHGLLFTDVGAPRTVIHPGKTDWRFSCARKVEELP